ncbi:MAG: hypothetical protein JST04_00825 [Bdellovibrionales bacterium]|nr:hypothetical protein [Bdellovibrionales bacterium]
MSEQIEEIEGQIVPLQMVTDIDKTYTKSDIAATLIHNVLDGKVEPSKYAVTLRRIKDAIELVFKHPKAKQVIEDDVTKYLEGKKAKILGAEVQLTTTYTKYDYSECGHTELDAINSIIEQLEDRKEQIEAELQLQLKTYEGNTAKKLGVTATTKSYIIEQLPELNWVSSGEVIDVKVPNKIQSIGLKFFKL